MGTSGQLEGGSLQVGLAGLFRVDGLLDGTVAEAVSVHADARGSQLVELLQGRVGGLGKLAVLVWRKQEWHKAQSGHNRGTAGNDEYGAKH